MEGHGLYPKYHITRNDGKPLPDSFEAFVLRLDAGGDPAHVNACWVAIRAYANTIQMHLPTLASDLKERYFLKFSVSANKPNITVELENALSVDEVLTFALDLEKFSNVVTSKIRSSINKTGPRSYSFQYNPEGWFLNEYQSETFISGLHSHLRLLGW